MNSALVPLSLVCVLTACSNQVVGSASNCDSGPKRNQQLALADNAALQSAPGGFLIYDEIATDSFVQTGNLSGNVQTNRKCSATFVPRAKNGKAFLDVTSAHECLYPFVWGALNQKIYLSQPDGSGYIDVKLKDERLARIEKFYALLSTLSLPARRTVVNGISVGADQNQGSYAEYVKKMNDVEFKSFAASQCWTVGKATPEPENCLWLVGTRSESIEIEPSSISDFALFVKRYEDFERSNLATLNGLSPGVGDKLSAFKNGYREYPAVDDDRSIRRSAGYWIDCDTSSPAKGCYMLTLEQRKKISLNFLSIFLPNRIKEYEAAFGELPDPALA